MGEVVILPVVRHESAGLAAQEARRVKMARGFPIATSESYEKTVQLTGDEPKPAIRRAVRRSLLGEDILA